MKKNIISLGIAASFLVAGMSAANAANSTTVNVHGTVSAATCDVSANTNDVNLGNYKKADFSSVGKPASSKQSFTISLANCAGLTTGATGGQANLQVTGPTTGSGNTYFNSDTSGVVGISLRQTGGTSDLSNNALVSVGSKGADGAALTAASTSFDVSMKSSQSSEATPTGLAVVAPLTFSFVYN